MRRLFTLTLLIAPLAVLPVQAQPYLPPPPPAYGQIDGVALVSGWVRQYLGRRPNRQDIANGQAIDAGTLDPNDLLPGILSCDEYYSRAGGDNARYIQKLFRDVAGRAPSQREADTWYRRLQDGPAGMDGRTNIAAALLQQYPPASLAPPEPVAPYRRPYDRDRDFDRDRR
jgi:hypothetical protein